MGDFSVIGDDMVLSGIAASIAVCISAGMMVCVINGRWGPGSGNSGAVAVGVCGVCCGLSGIGRIAA